jgi:Spy/CpxP family protein refolding chaperone
MNKGGAEMKNILRVLVVIALVFGLSFQLFAQVPQRQKDRQQKDRQMKGAPQEFLAEHLEKLSKELNLTPEQKEILSRIIEERKEERKQERAEKMAQMKKELHRKDLDRLSEDLQLTPAQTEKISQIVEDGWQRITKERKKMMKTVRAVRISVDKRIEKILTPEQREKFEILKKQPSKQRMEGIKRQRSGVRGNRSMKGIPPEPK